MVIFHGYVSLPEGRIPWLSQKMDGIMPMFGQSQKATLVLCWLGWSSSQIWKWWTSPKKNAICGRENHEKPGSTGIWGAFPEIFNPYPFRQGTSTVSTNRKSSRCLANGGWRHHPENSGCHWSETNQLWDFRNFSGNPWIYDEVMADFLADVWIFWAKISCSGHWKYTKCIYKCCFEHPNLG